jgi:hypothetical protein
MQKPCFQLKWITRIWIIFACTLLLPAMGFAESLEDGMIMRENAKIFMKDGSAIECARFWWIVSAEDIIQCDKGDHADEIKLKDVDFEKTFGKDLAREYAEMKGELAASQEKSKQGRKTERVVSSLPSELHKDESTPSSEKEKETKTEPAQATKHAKPVEKLKEKPWDIKPGKGVGWITLGMPYEKIIASLGKTVMESELPPHGKHQRYGIQGLEFYYKHDLITAIRIGKSTNKKYSHEKYKYSGLGLGSNINDVVKVMGKPDYITISKYTSVHSYVYKSGILFSKFKSKDIIYTITIFPKDKYSLYAKN